MHITSLTLTTLSKKAYLQLAVRLKNKKTKAFTTLTLTLLGIMFFGFFAIQPTIATIVKLRKELSDSRTANEALSKKITDLTTLQQKYNLLQEDIPFVLRALPQTPTIPPLVGQIQALASQNDVSITTLQTFPVDISQSQQKKEGSFGFSIEVEGSFQSISSFMNALIGFERIVTIELFSITESDQAKDLKKVSIRGQTYFKE